MKMTDTMTQTTASAAPASHAPRHPFPSAAKPPAALQEAEAKVTKPIELIAKEKTEMAEAKPEVKKPAADTPEAAALKKKWIAARERDEGEANKKIAAQTATFEALRELLIVDLNAGSSLAKLYARFKEVAGADIMSQKVFQAAVVALVKDKDSGVSKEARKDILERVEAAKTNAKTRKENDEKQKAAVSGEKPVQNSEKK
jgi:hypothetical protein